MILDTSKKVLSAAGVAALAVAGLAATTGPANAARTADPCANQVGSITADGHHGSAGVVATTPPTSRQAVGKAEIFKPGEARLQTNTVRQPDVGGGVDVNGYVVKGDNLYSFSYLTDGAGDLQFPVHLAPITVGFGTADAIESSDYEETSGGFHREHFYKYDGLDGELTRWTVTSGKFASPVAVKLGTGIKAMALISKTRTYDTFLVNTKAGELKTVRIPTTAAPVPVVKTVRARSWQGFESFVAHKCGSGTVLTAIDKDTKAGYVYTLGKANGAATAITSHGKVPAAFDAPVFFRWGVVPDLDPLNGE